jgi:hypothetical protein
MDQLLDWGRAVAEPGLWVLPRIAGILLNSQETQSDIQITAIFVCHI